MYKQKIGSRAQVMHGTAKMTGGGLTKRQLKYNKHGKIVSIKASKAAKKSKNLIKGGYITKKGIFGWFWGRRAPNTLFFEVLGPEGSKNTLFLRGFRARRAKNTLFFQAFGPEGPRKQHFSEFGCPKGPKNNMF